MKWKAVKKFWQLVGAKKSTDLFELNNFNNLWHKKWNSLTRSMVQSQTSLMFDGATWYSETAGKRFLNLCGGEIKRQICYQLQYRTNSEKKAEQFHKTHNSWIFERVNSHVWFIVVRILWQRTCRLKILATWKNLCLCQLGTICGYLLFGGFWAWSL